MGKWIGVDFDGTLATYEGWQGTKLGKPIPKMVARIKRWLSEGIEVRIVTARAFYVKETRPEYTEADWNPEQHIAAIKGWCKTYLGQELAVQAHKDFEMAELWDDRAVSVEPNTGRVTTDRSPEYEIKLIGKSITRHERGCNDRPRNPRGCDCGADHQ